jgi:hypothetical protein
MKTALAVWALVLALAWLPLAHKFRAAWLTRRNPVSLAICLVMLLFAYQNVMFMLAIEGMTTWRFYSIATRLFEAIAILNFFIAFRWSDTKFAGNRRSDAEQPPAA